MIMHTIVAKALFPFSLAGLLAAAELEPGSWLQMGVAGLSLFVLFWTITRTLPDVVTKIMQGHAASNEAVCAKLDEVKKELSDGRVDQLNLLREAVKG
jgi:hypothetical protein